MSSRAEAKARARAQREAAERAEAQSAARKRRLMILGGVLAAAVVVIVVVIVISQSGTEKPVSAKEGQTQANTLFAGIPQSGNVLGDPKAPVTIEEYIDLQCPYCQRFSQDGLPDVVKDYVKTGQAKLVMQTLTFIGPDSERAARVAWAAGDQNKMFPFVENFYANQGEENSGYADDAFMKKIAGGVNGLDVQKALDQRSSTQISSSIQNSQSSAQKANVDSTPTFLIGPTGGQLSKIDTQTLTVDDFRQPMKDALAESKNAN